MLKHARDNGGKVGRERSLPRLASSISAKNWRQPARFYSALTLGVNGHIARAISTGARAC
jgi:hypothetical protein